MSVFLPCVLSPHALVWKMIMWMIVVYSEQGPGRWRGRNSSRFSTTFTHGEWTPLTFVFIASVLPRLLVLICKLVPLYTASMHTPCLFIHVCLNPVSLSLQSSSLDLKAVVDRPTSPVLPTTLEVRNALLRNESPSPFLDKRTRPRSTNLESSSLATTASHENTFLRRSEMCWLAFYLFISYLLVLTWHNSLHATYIL